MFTLAFSTSALIIYIYNATFPHLLMVSRPNRPGPLSFKRSSGNNYDIISSTNSDYAT